MIHETIEAAIEADLDSYVRDPITGERCLRDRGGLLYAILMKRDGGYWVDGIRSTLDHAIDAAMRNPGWPALQVVATRMVYRADGHYRRVIEIGRPIVEE